MISLFPLDFKHLCSHFSIKALMALENMKVYEFVEENMWAKGTLSSVGRVSTNVMSRAFKKTSVEEK